VRLVATVGTAQQVCSETETSRVAADAGCLGDRGRWWGSPHAARAVRRRCEATPAVLRTTHGENENVVAWARNRATTGGDGFAGAVAPRWVAVLPHCVGGAMAASRSGRSTSKRATGRVRRPRSSDPGGQAAGDTVRLMKDLEAERLRQRSSRDKRSMIESAPGVRSRILAAI
jgi:hypothetical protein